MTPSDEAECRRMLYDRLRARRPDARCATRAAAAPVPIPSTRLEPPAGRQGRNPPPRPAHRAPRLRHPAGSPPLAAGDELDATVANMRFVKPIDRDLIVELAGNHAAAGHARRERRDRRRRLRSRRGCSTNAGLTVPVLQPGLARPLHRPRRTRPAPRRARPRQGRHRAHDARQTPAQPGPTSRDNR